MIDNNDAEQDHYYCPECQAGVLKIAHVTYFAQVPGEMITAPDFPAWVCDICGFQEYDSLALTWLYVLLDHSPARSAKRANRPHAPADEAPSPIISK